MTVLLVLAYFAVAFLLSAFVSGVLEREYTLDPLDQRAFTLLAGLLWPVTLLIWLWSWLASLVGRVR